mgnify:FL=1
MPDLQNFSITPMAAANINVPRATISAQITDSQTGEVLADFTGGNALTFPGVLTTLTAAQRQELINLIATTIVFMKAGLE